MAFDNTNFLEVDATVEADFIFTNKNGVVDSGLQVRGTSLQWCLETTGETTSGGTGATANPPGRSAYVYTEATETGTPASALWAMRRNITFDNTTQNIFLDLIYNRNFEAASQLLIEYATVASPNETTDWTILESIAGNLTDAWISDTFDFSAVPQTTTLHLRLRVNANAAFTNDVCVSTWREYSVDTATPGAGFVIVSADKTVSPQGAEDPASFSLSGNEPWATFTSSLLLDTGLPVGSDTLSPTSTKRTVKTTGNITFENGAKPRGSYDGPVFLTEIDNVQDCNFLAGVSYSVGGETTWDNVQSTGDLVNTDATQNLIVNLVNGSTATTSTPGTGNGQVDRRQSVPITVTVSDFDTLLPVEGAAVYIEIVGTQEVAINAETDQNGVATAVFTSSTPAVINSAVSGVKSGSSVKPYQYFPIFGSIESGTGFTQTVSLNED